MNKITLFFSMCMAALIAAGTTARADTEFTFQGELKDSGGLATGSFNLDVTLWDALVGGNQIGSPLVLIGVPVTEGRFSVEFDFGPAAFDNSGRWLEIAVEGVTLSPRHPITRSPYSIQTRGIFVDENENVGIGTSNPQNALHVASSATSNIAIYGHTNESGGTGVTGEATRPSLVNAGVHGISHSPAGWGVWGEAVAGGYGVYGSSTGEFARGISGVGYGAQAKGVYGSGDQYGVYGLSAGYGVYGQAGGSGVTHGVYGKSTSSSGRGLYGNADHPSGVTYAVIGQVDSPAGYAAYFIGPAGSQNYFSRDVGINTLSPGYLLHVNGSAGKPGGGSWSNSSDRRLKKNIEDLDGSLDQLMKLRGVTFEYKDPDSINELHGTRIGMIAQEAEEVFPDWVDVRDDGYKTITHRGFEALTVEALRELRAEKDAQIKSQTKRVAKIERENKKLLAENDRLAARFDSLEQLVEQLTTNQTEQMK